MVRILFIMLIVSVPVAFAGNGGTLQSDAGAAKAGVPNTETRDSGSLTTIFAANGGGAGQMFDILPHVFINEITGLDVNIGSIGEVVEIHVYYKEETCVNHELDETAWTLLGTGTGLSAGQDNPTFIDLSGNGVHFERLKTYGIYVHQYNYPSITGHLRRTNGGPNTYNSPEMTLTTHCSNLYPAFTSKFLYRIWNGTIYYDWQSPPPSLYVVPSSFNGWEGGEATFMLTAGPDQIGSKYIIMASVSGTSPGITLPGGLIMPLNFDWVTYLMLELVLTGYPLFEDFVGEFQSTQAKATLTIPEHVLINGMSANWAWCTFSPFDLVSVPEFLQILPAPQPPPSYAYDDGTSELAAGWTGSGEAVWCHTFDSGIGDVINSVSSAFGSPYTPEGPANGDPCWVYVWHDPNGDGDPTDGVLVGEGSGLIANSRTDIINHYLLDTPAAVQGRFFVACHCWQNVGVYAAPLDKGTPYNKNTAWFMGGSIFNKHDLTTTEVSARNGVWLLRANAD